MTELQQSKYQDLQAGLPSELSMQLAEVALALGSAEDQVTNGFHWKTKKCCDVFAFLFFSFFWKYSNSNLTCGPSILKAPLTRFLLAVHQTDVQNKFTQLEKHSI